MPPIILDPSNDSDLDVLVNAIASATRLNVPLLLKPGIHFTKPGRDQHIPIGPNGLRLTGTPASPGSAQPAAQAIIKRPDQSIDLAAPDDNYGLFFVPSAPTLDEVAGITWKSHVDASGKKFEFGIIIRANIEVNGISIDCNMGQQQLGTLPKNVAEHSAMLGFAGKKYSTMLDDAGQKQSIPQGPNGEKRFVYVGFQSVRLQNVTTLNGGYADDVWFSRGYFNPNIERVVIEGLRSSGVRISPKRATLSFSGLCQNIQIRDADIDELHMEDTTRQHYNDLPRQATVFTPATLSLSKIKARHIGLAAKGKVYKLAAKDLTATESFTLYQAGGVIRNSTLRVNQERRLIRLDDFVFDQVTWQLDPDDTGMVRGLKPTSDEGDPCSVTFRRNIFLVSDASVSGEIITSSYSPTPSQSTVPENRVTVSFLGCTYPQDFGRSAEKPIACVNERGVWTFAVKDLGNRDPDVAVVKGSQPGIELKWV